MSTVTEISHVKFSTRGVCVSVGWLGFALSWNLCTRTVVYLAVSGMRKTWQHWLVPQLNRAGCLSFCVGRAFHGIRVNPGGRGVINNPADMWSGWGFRVSERACLKQCTALWYLWYQSSQGSWGMQLLFLLNHNASGNVLSCSSNLGLFCHWTLVIITLCWHAALFHSMHFSTFPPLNLQ